LEGETGTGKELFAEFIHQYSKRNNKPLVAINCASLPDQLMESELFGYEKGAFTGANTRKIGKLERADRGSAFLDEIILIVSEPLSQWQRVRSL
jgi:transcriptional regulator with PAS, ATPase and Fis domain